MFNLKRIESHRAGLATGHPTAKRLIAALLLLLAHLQLRQLSATTRNLKTLGGKWWKCKK
jgi:hypothetical protein